MWYRRKWRPPGAYQVPTECPSSVGDYVRAAMHASSVVAVATFAISSSVMDPTLFATCRFLRNDTRYQFASVQKSGSGNMLRVLRTSEKYDYYDFQKRAKTTTTAARFFITGPRTCPIP
ncbi:unnamed protein product [Lasius platythorax]